LGSMLITKIYLAAMSRADVSEKELQKLPNFYLYVDEFQSFANESFADILSEARKYKLNLTIAHQYIEQMSEEVRAAVFGNVGTMITFRVGAFDAEVLEKEFAPQFTAEDLVNLGMFQIYLKLMIDGASSQPFSASSMPPIKEPEVSYRTEVIEMSRKQFAMKRAGVEQAVIDWHKDSGIVPKKEEKKTEAVIPLKTAPATVPTPAARPAAAKIFEKPKYFKREDARPVPLKPVIPPPDLPADDDFVPLTELKAKPITVNNVTNNNQVTNNISNNGKKVVNEKSLADLRAVLQGLTKDKKVEPAKISETETFTGKEKKEMGEIPEYKLRQMLQVDKNPDKNGQVEI